MALASRVGKVSMHLKKGLAATFLVIRTGSRSAIAADPTITTGSGAPSGSGHRSENEPNGSIYTDTAGTNGDDCLYVKVAGAWKVIKGETA